MVPVLSPFYGAQGIEEEKPVVKKGKEGRESRQEGKQ